jgi:ribulose 1,5-bisphosphate synthetase/thiazole synthase
MTANMLSKTDYLPSYRLREAEVEGRQSPGTPINNRHLTNASVVIIGGGISGMCTAIDLIVKQNVKNFVILEKSGGFGGTW